MKRRIEIALLSGGLLAAGCVFIAWPPARPLPERPLTVFEAARALPVEEAELAAAPPAVQTAAALAAQTEAESTASVVGPRERVSVRAHHASDRVHVHGCVRRRGAAVGDVDLLFQPMGAGLDDWEEWEFTDAEGAFEVFLSPGSYLVLSDEGQWLTNVELLSGEKDRILDIDLPAGVARGRVVWEGSGRPVSAGTLHALRSDDGPATDAITQGLMSRAGEARTRDDGTFELVDLIPGEYLVIAEHDRRLTPPRRVFVADTPGEELVLTLAQGHTVEGVVFGPGNEPVAMELQVLPGTDLASLTQLEIFSKHYSDYDGRFVIEGLAPGEHLLIGRGETRTHDLALHTVIDVRPNASPIELRAARCGSLSVTVTHSDGTPVRKAHLDIRAADGTLVLPSLEWLEGGGLSDAEGRIEVDDVAPGWYRVAAGSRGLLGEPVPVQVRSEQTTQLALVLDGDRAR